MDKGAVVDSISGIPAIDVAIGLMFLFFLLSVVCSQVNELVASRLNFRAKELEGGIRSLLGDRAEGLMADPFINGVREGARLPSYLGARTFALALMNQLAPESGASLSAVRSAIADLPDDNPAKAPLTRFVAEAGDDVEAFRKRVEGWFDDAMDRVSGWYRRNAQKWLLVYATVLTLGLNVDTALIARTLWRDDAVRAAVVASAATAEEPESAEDFEEVARNVEEVQQLDLPLGWSTAAGDPRAWPGLAWASVWRVGGWVLTILALSLGAPFWFDLLGKVSRLRQTGVRPKDEPQPAEGRDHPASPPLPTVPPATAPASPGTDPGPAPGNDPSGSTPGTQ